MKLLFPTIDFEITSNLALPELTKILSNAIEPENFLWNPAKKHNIFKGKAINQNTLFVKIPKSTKNYSPIVKIFIEENKDKCHLLCQARLPSMSYFLTVIWILFLSSLFILSSAQNIYSQNYDSIFFPLFILVLLTVGIIFSKRKYLLEIEKIKKLLIQLVSK